MSEQYECSECHHILTLHRFTCPQCHKGELKRLRWTKGGDGSHWDGCDEVHWDCKIAKLEAENATLNDASKTFAEIYDARVSALEAENKRLRSALEQIADNKWRTEKGLIEFARTALEQK